MLEQIMSFISVPVLAALGASLVVALSLVVTKNWHGHLSMDSHAGIQKFHTDPTPRIGGVAIAIGVVVGALLTDASNQKLLFPLILAGIPAFAFGLLEDVTKRVSVRTRLLATMGCGVLGWIITGLSITKANVIGLDWILSFQVMSVIFTAFAVGGVANAINIIDGFNGLAGGSVTIILLGFSALAWSMGDQALFSICLILAGAVLGFLPVNWPFGKIFLGDGGAYFVGFALAWLAVLLLARHTQVSAWAPMLVCGYPILEVLFSIVRRRRRHLSPGDPDRLHLHSLVKRRFVRSFMPKASSLARNSMTGAIMWLAALLPVLVALKWPNDTSKLLSGFFFYAIIYITIYNRLVRFSWRLARPVYLVSGK